jgi:hypothetical protein
MIKAVKSHQNNYYMDLITVLEIGLVCLFFSIPISYGVLKAKEKISQSTANRQEISKQDQYLEHHKIY